MSELPEVGWLKDSDNRWGVPIVDVRPIALGMIATSKDPQCAANAVSFNTEDGACFAKVSPRGAKNVPVRLSLPVSPGLYPGCLFTPREMEEKWAIFFHEGRILFVRSWTRELIATAAVRPGDGVVHIDSVHGSFVTEDEPADLTQRVLEYLLRSHALDEVYPAPLPAEPNDLSQAALWCFSMFGNRALLATAHALPPMPVSRPLRTDSLHIAIARGDRAAATGQLDSGVPIDLLARDGLATLHWALASRDPAMPGWLIDQGCAVDVRSVEGATPLMNAVQASSEPLVRDLIARGADVNARDARGFTSLHRAAEKGLREVARLLLDRGADPSADALGHTALSLARAQGHEDLARLLER